MMKKLGYVVAATGMLIAAGVSANMSADDARVLVELEDTAEEFRTMLPVQLDESTVWTNVEAGPGLTVHYHYALDFPTRMDMGVFEQMQRNRIVNDTCGDPDAMHDFRRGVSYAYHYETENPKDDSASIEVDIDDCF